jgi:membrane protease YdiL (CAAX protease family)
VEPAPPNPEPSPPPARVLPIQRVGAALEVLLCSGFPTQLIISAVLVGFGLRPQTADGRFNAPFIFALTLTDTVLLVGLVCFFLRAHRQSIRANLFGSRPLGLEVLFGFGLIPVSFFVVVLVLVLVQLVVPSMRNVPHNPLADLARTRGQAILFAFVVMVAGGVREEIQRGFILRRFEQFLGGGMTGLIVFSALFGLGHLEQGRDVAVATAVVGAFWGAIFLGRRSVAGPMVGHAGFNLLQVAKFLTQGG